MTSKRKSPGGQSVQPEEGLHKGVDIWMIRENLMRSFEERVAQHQKMLEIISELNQIGRNNRERLTGPSKTAGS